VIELGHEPAMKILVADDDADLRSLICFTLAQAGYEVCSAGDGPAAIETFERESPSLLVLDVNMPKLDGFEVCREIRRRSTVPIMMLTVRDREDDIVMGLECGADDYVRKPFSPRALVARIRALARRAAQNEASVLAFGELQLNLEAHTLSIGGATEIHLTPLQLKALQLLIANNGRTVTAERLMTHLWGSSTRRERHSLKQLIHRLRDRLAQEARAPEVLLTTPGAGYRIASPRAVDGLKGT